MNVKNVWKILFPERVVCVVCGRPSRGELICEQCQEELDALRLDGTVEHAAYRYDGAAKKLIHRLKFDNVTAAATVLARAVALDALKLHIAPDTVVTWVTMPEKRRKERGIDHGQVLARAVALRLGLECRRLLIRSQENPFRTQRGSSKARRLRNLQGMFAAEENLPRYILLVDDVLTTGATTETCAACLRAGGAHVSVLTAAKVVKNLEG